MLNEIDTAFDRKARQSEGSYRKQATEKSRAINIAHLTQCISPVFGSLIRGITSQHLTAAAAARTDIIQDRCSTFIIPQYNLPGQYAGIIIRNATNYIDMQI
jgi:hypothetical protein